MPKENIMRALLAENQLAMDSLKWSFIETVKRVPCCCSLVPEPIAKVIPMPCAQTVETPMELINYPANQCLNPFKVAMSQVKLEDMSLSPQLQPLTIYHFINRTSIPRPIHMSFPVVVPTHKEISYCYKPNFLPCLPCSEQPKALRSVPMKMIANSQAILMITSSQVMPMLTYLPSVENTNMIVNDSGNEDIIDVLTFENEDNAYEIIEREVADSNTIIDELDFEDLIICHADDDYDIITQN